MNEMLHLFTESESQGGGWVGVDGGRENNVQDESRLLCEIMDSVVLVLI